MRMLFTCIGATGQFYPLVQLARVAAQHGHEVAFATGTSFCPVVQATGFQTFPAGFDYNGASLDDWFPQLRTLRGEAYRLFIARNVRIDIQARHMVSDLLDVASRGYRPDLVVRDAAEYGGCLAAEIWGVPHASVRTAYSASCFSRRLLVGRELGDVRRGCGLPPDGDVEMPFRYLHLACEPPGFWPAGACRAPTSHLLKPAVFDRPHAEHAPSWVAQLPPERPTVCATLGTFMNRSTDVFDAILRGVADEAVNLVVLVGQDVDPDQFGPQPENVHIARYIPLSLLLPHCDLVISQAGFGTVVSTLAHGLAAVLIPLGADQPENAQSCERLGVCRVLGEHERTAAHIKSAVREVLMANGYRARAEQVRRAMRRLPGTPHAVHLLEQLAVERQPILAQSHEVAP